LKIRYHVWRTAKLLDKAEEMLVQIEKLKEKAKKHRIMAMKLLEEMKL